jgi:2TM domain
MPQTSEDQRLPGLKGNDAAGFEPLARQEAIKQIQRRRHFRMEFVASAIGMMVLVAIWAVTEYHNAGGWPFQGFSQCSGIHDVWNSWIIYPIVGWALIMASRAWVVGDRKPVTEADIEREMRRRTGH